MCQSFIGSQSHYNSPIFWGFVSLNLLKIMLTKNHFWCKFYVLQKFWESFRNFAQMRQLVTLCQCWWKCWLLCYTSRGWVAGPMSRLFCPQNIIDILLAVHGRSALPSWKVCLLVFHQIHFAISNYWTIVGTQFHHLLWFGSGLPIRRHSYYMMSCLYIPDQIAPKNFCKFLVAAILV